LFGKNSKWHEIMTKQHIKILNISLLLCAIILGAGINTRLFSWGLFNLFSDHDYRAEGQKRAEEFDPDRDILYLPSMQGKNLFQSVNDLSVCRNRHVRKFLYIYLTSGRDYVIQGIENSEHFNGIISDIFSRHKDVPEGLAMLPLLESKFDPRAVSRSRAVGLWQFMRNTSRPLGLKHNSWVDERRDIELSTEAAVIHLNNLYRQFNSWGFALAAYNGGSVTVKRAIKKSGAKNIWELIDSGALRKETSEYVPRFIALLLIYRNQGLFDIRDEISSPDIMQTEIIELPSPVSIHQVAHYSGTPVSIIKKYNPELKRPVTPPYTRKYPLRLPVGSAEKLREHRDVLYPARYSRVIRYRVRQGDCISSIAGRYKKKLLL